MKNFFPTAFLFVFVPHKILVEAFGDSIDDCKAFAQKFDNTCDHGDYDTPADSVAVMASESLTCTQRLCFPGGVAGDNTCTWERKLCVTCSQESDGDVYIHVQTNNMPNHCIKALNINVQNFDFKVKFNQQRSPGTSGCETNWANQNQLNNKVCRIGKSYDTADLGLVENGSDESENAHGIALNGVIFQFANLIAEDPVAGAGQKRPNFWNRIHCEFYQIHNEEAEVAVADQWSIKSVQDRFFKLEKEVKAFNIYYKQIQKKHDKSGWTPEMVIGAAKALFEEVEGRPFKHGTCARILHKIPKYDPNKEEEDQKVARVQGRDMEVPMGNKKAKKMKLLDKLGEQSAATTAQTDALKSVAAAASGLALSMERKRVVDSMHKQVSSYIKLGMVEEAKKTLAEIQNYEVQVQELEDKKKAAATVPSSIDLEGNSIVQEVIDTVDIAMADEVQVVASGPHYKSAPDVLDDGDEPSSSGEESENEDDDGTTGSQSADSKLVKVLYAE